jgi:hypothetical protein
MPEKVPFLVPFWGFSQLLIELGQMRSSDFIGPRHLRSLVRATSPTT